MTKPAVKVKQTKFNTPFAEIIVGGISSLYYL